MTVSSAVSNRLIYLHMDSSRDVSPFVKGPDGADVMSASIGDLFIAGVVPGLRISDFALQIPDVSFPFNVSAGPSRYQRKKLLFGFLELTVDADLVALEANHDKDVLQFCRYPYHIKRRILSDHGHLSNDAAGECICRLVGDNTKKRQILLSHLSHENNTPEIAKVTITNIMETAGIYAGGDVLIDVITREEISSIYVL